MDSLQTLGETGLVGALGFALTHALHAAFPALGGKWLQLVALGCCLLSGAVMVSAFHVDPKLALSQTLLATLAAIGVRETTRKDGR